MTRVCAFLLVASLVLLVCGCAAFQGEKETSTPPETGKRQEIKVAASADAQRVAAGPRLEQHGFAILDFRAIRDGFDRLSVVGEIKNVGSGARGVELQASLRDPAGRLVAVGHFCPASYKNIQPGEVWPFTYAFGSQQEAVHAELRIVGAFHTMDILNVAATAP